jgi:hypothetical protein
MELSPAPCPSPRFGGAFFRRSPVSFSRSRVSHLGRIGGASTPGPASDEAVLAGKGILRFEVGWRYFHLDLVPAGSRQTDKRAVYAGGSDDRNPE